MKKRIFSILLIYCLILSMLPMQVLAENNVLSGGANILPKSEETLNVGEVPASEEASTIEKASASEKVSDIEETPASEEVSDIEETPASEEISDIEEAPASEEVPEIEEAPASKEVPEIEEAPASKEVLDAEEVPDSEEASVCTCTGKCTPADEENGIAAVINKDCPVCGAENADLTLCKGTQDNLLSMAGVQAMSSQSSQRATTLDLTTNDYQTGLTPVGTVWTNDAEGWSYDTSTMTLTLSGINISSADTTDKSTCGIKLPDGATITLADGTSNFVNSGNAGVLGSGLDVSSYGLYGVGALTIDGTGSLEVGSGTASKESTGIWSSGTVTINSGIVTINSGTALNSFGMRSENGAVIINSGTVSIYGGSTYGNVSQTLGCGIGASGEISISNGTGVVLGNNYAYNKQPTLKNGMTISGSWHDTQVYWPSSVGEARWGLAKDDGSAPDTWASSGTLKDAMYYANILNSSRVYIQLLRDVCTTRLTLEDHQAAVLDLNGKTFHGIYGCLMAYGDLILTDSSTQDVTKQGRITGGNTSIDSGVTVSNSTFTMNGGNITGNISDAGSAVTVELSASFIMNGGAITNNTTKNRGAVEVGSKCNFTMNSGSISDNTGIEGGGVLVAGYNTDEESSFTMNGGEIARNTVQGLGGGVYAQNGGKVTINNGSSIHDNCAAWGGGIYASDITMNGGEITGNRAVGGGGVFNVGSFTMKGGSISNNRADATLTNPYSDMSIDEGAGGGVYTVDSKSTILAGTITQNSATTDGGGMYVYGFGTYIVGGTANITGNHKDNNSNSNLYLCNLGYNLGDLITVSTENPLKEGASIGVTTKYSPTVQTPLICVTKKNNSDVTEYFSSDSGYAVLNSETDNIVQFGSSTPTAPIITTTSLPDGVIDGVYSQKLKATGYPKVTWSLDSGSLPEGLQLEAATGIISGIPKVAGKSNFTVRATNNVSPDDTKVFSISVTGPEARWGLSGTDGALPTTWVNNGKLADAMTYANSLTSGTAYIQLLSDVPLSNSLNFESNKTTILDLNGRTLDANKGNFSILSIDGILTLKDTSSTDVTKQGKITGSINSGVFVNPSGSFTMIGGNVTGNSANNGGGVSVAGVFTMVGGKISDNITNNAFGGGVYVMGNIPSFTVGGTAIITGNRFEMGYMVATNNVFLVKNQSYNQIMKVSPTTPLAEGASIGVTTQKKPTSSEIIDITDQNTSDVSKYFVSDDSRYMIQNGTDHVVQLGLNSSPTAPTITTTSLPDGIMDTAYNQTLAATGSMPITWSVYSGKLPSGLSLNGSTGVISGTPTTFGTFTFTVMATNGTQPDAYKNLTINVTSPIAVSLPSDAASLDFGSVYTGYDAQAEKTVTLTNNGTAAITIAQPTSSNYDIGTLTQTNISPGGTATFTVVPKNGLSVKNYNEVIEVKSGTRTFGKVSVKFTVSAPVYAAPTITTTSLPDGVVNTAYSQTLTATGYPTTMTWSVSSGSLPAGLSLNTSTGAITGTPTTAGKCNFVIKVANSAGSATKAFSITVTSSITSVVVSPSTATVKKSKTQQFTATVTATGTTTDKSVKWTVTGGTKSTINEDGLLTVGLTETATTLTVKAESTVDSSKYGTSTVTVTAAPKVYTVTFNSDGGAPDRTSTSGIEEGNTISLPNAPTKENYRFDGWFTEKNGSGSQFTSATPVNSSITVYAKWTKLVTVKGVVVNYDDTPIQGAKVTLSPAYGTLAAITDADGKFSFANIPEDSFTATATFADTSTVNVNITSDYGNVKIVKPKPYITITTQPQDATLVKGIAGQSAVFTIEGTRTPYIADKVGYQWYWQKGTIPDTMQDELMTGSGSQMTLNQDNNNIPDRGTYKIYGYAYDADEAIEAYSRTATLTVVGTNTIEGIVKKTDGTPVIGATVKLEYAGGDWPYGSVAITDSTNPQTTLTDGKYKFELVPDGKYKLIITLPEGGKIIYGPYDFPGPGPVTPPSPIDPDIVIPDEAKIQVNGQPQDATAKNGTAVNLSVDAASTDGTALTYQWYSNTKNANSGGTVIDGATAKDYSVPTTDKGTNYYYCVVSGGSLTAATTRAAKVTVFTYGIIQGTVQTKEKQPIAGATVELINIDTPVKTGFTTSTNPQTTLADGKYKFVEVPDGTYKLKITLPGTDPFIFVVEPINIPNVNPDIPAIPPDKPTISMTKQPKSMTVALHDTAEFTTGAGVSTVGTVLYQWYSNTTNSSSGGTAIDGATSATYQASTNTKGITYYYCVVQATDAEAVTSNIAKLTVRNTPVNNLMTIEGDVVDDNGSKIQNAEVTLSPKAGTSENPQTTKVDGHYKFENLPDGSYTITVKLPGGGVNTKKIVIVDGDITPTPPNNIDIPATNSITISKQPQSIEVTTEKTADFTAKATATKADVTYQWYKSTTNTNSGGEKLEGKTGETLSLDKQPESVSYYYCVVSSTGAPDKATDAAKLTVTKASGNSGDLNGKIVEDVNGDTVKDATVKLMKNGTDGIQFGSDVKTGNDGKFEFTDIPYGSYSLVAEKDTSMVTRQITIRAASTSENLTIPSGAKITKMVIGDDTPSAAVENLESMFTDADNTIAQQPGATVEIKLVIEKQDTPSDGSDIDTALTENQHVGIYLNAKLVRTISGTVAEDGTEYIQPHSGQTLRIVLDLDKDLQGKTDYKVIRSHTENGVTDVRMITPDVDSSLQTLSFDADAFSTYAVVYTQAPKYSMTVIDSQAGAASGTGLYEAGKTVTIQAGDKSGYTFDGWTTTDGVSFQSANSSTTTFTMPANNVTVTAKWKSNGSGSYNGGGNNNPGGGNNIPGGDNNNPGGGNNNPGGDNNNPGGGNNTPGGDNNNPGGNNNTPGGDNNNPGGNNNTPGGDNNNSGGNNTTPGGDNITSDQENTVASVSNTTSGGGNNTSGKSNNTSNKGNNNSGVTNNLGDSSSSDNTSVSALNDAKSKALQQLADERQKAIDALPDSVNDKKRQAALDEIDRIYNDAIKAIQDADSTGTISDTIDQAVHDFANVVSGVDGKVPTQATVGKGKPFVLLSAAMVAASVMGAVLVWRRKEDEEADDDNSELKRSRLITLAATAVTILLFLLTTGWHGIAFANWWTIAVAVPSMGSLLYAFKHK